MPWLEATLSIVPECLLCTRYQKEHGDVLLEMQPGSDGIPWFLCIRCWLDGFLPFGKSAQHTGRVVE